MTSRGISRRNGQFLNNIGNLKMNIENLTYNELKQIAALFSGSTQPTKPSIHAEFIGKFCIARCTAAGVHAGEVVSVDGGTVVLKDSRRLWKWKTKSGVALSGVAQHGLDLSGSKLDEVNPQILLNGVCELIVCTKKSQESLS
jgi:hypothetical protein